MVQDTSLQHGHGATVADSIVQGIMAAESQPGRGGANVKIMPIRDTSSGLNIDSNALIRGVYWAADHGAAVINLSVNYSYDPVLNDPGDPHNGDSLSQAIVYAQTRGRSSSPPRETRALNIDQLLVYPPYSDDPLYSTASPSPTNLLVAAAVDSSGNLTPGVELGTGARGSGGLFQFAGLHVLLRGVHLRSGRGDRGVASSRPLGAGRQERDSPDRHAACTVSRRLVHIRGRDQSRGCRRAGRFTGSGGRCGQHRAGAGYSGDAYYSGGSTYATTEAIDTSGVASPAPQQVYQTERYGNFTYTIPHLVPGSPYIVRLDFAEIYWNAPGQRLFNVTDQRKSGSDKLRYLRHGGGQGHRPFAAVRVRRRQRRADRRSSSRRFATMPRSAASKSFPRPTWRWVSRLTRPRSRATATRGAWPSTATMRLRWSSGQWMQQTGTGWISVDLGAIYNVSEVRLDWETAYAVDYQIQTSLDGVNWVVIKTESGNQNPGLADSPAFQARDAMCGSIARRPARGSNNYSLYNLQVLGTPVVDLAQGRPASASTVESSSYAPQMAVDGNSGTRWSSGQWMQSSSTGWIYVDLGANFDISEVRLNWETAYAVNYQIQTSTDAPELDDHQDRHRQPEQGDRRLPRPLRHRPLCPDLLHPDQPGLGQLLALRLPGLRYAGGFNAPTARRIADLFHLLDTSAGDEPAERDLDGRGRSGAHSATGDLEDARLGVPVASSTPRLIRSTAPLAALASADAAGSGDAPGSSSTPECQEDAVSGLW